MNEGNLEEMFAESKRLRKSISRIKNFLTCGILVIVVVFLTLMWSLFKNFDKEKLISALTSEMKTLAPVISESAVDIVQEVLPVYQDALRKEFARITPQVKKEIDKEVLLFSNYAREEVPQLLQDELGPVIERGRVRILNEFPELIEDEDKILQGLVNLGECFKEEAQQLTTTGIFSHQAELLRDIYDTLHEDFSIRKSNETTDELSERLINLLGRIVEYEFFAEKLEEAKLKKVKNYGR